MTTLEKVQAQIAKLQARADELIAKQSTTVIAKIRDIMQKHALTTADIDAYIGGTKRARPTVSKSAEATSNVSAGKYRDPKTGATWSGRGRAPAWIASVKDRSRFLVEGVDSGTPVAAKGGDKRLGNYVRGPQPAKYRDPKSGATWSGRGRAPAWLSGVKNLAPYLIGEAGNGMDVKSDVSVAKPTANKKGKAVVKKAAAKNAVVKKAVTQKTAAKTKAAAKSPVPTKARVKKTTEKAPAARKTTARAATQKRAAPIAKSATRRSAVQKGTVSRAPGANIPVVDAVSVSANDAAQASV